MEENLEEGKLYPSGLRYGEEELLRRGFKLKVYGTLAAQMVLTTILSSAIVLYSPIKELLWRSLDQFFFFQFLPLIFCLFLYIFRGKHPLNHVFLGLSTVSISIPTGIVCSSKEGKVVFEALILTSALVSALTCYTFLASSRKGKKDFSYLELFLVSGFILLFLIGFIQMLFPVGLSSVAICGAFFAMASSECIVYDPEKLTGRSSYDNNYILSSTVIYFGIMGSLMGLNFL